MNITTDQTITLVGGTKFIITDVMITNASVNIDTAKDFQLQSVAERGRSSHMFCQSQLSEGGATDPSLSNLTVPERFVNGQSSADAYKLKMNPSQFTSGETLYASLGTAQGESSTADIYVYGYVL